MKIKFIFDDKAVHFYVCCAISLIVCFVSYTIFPIGIITSGFIGLFITAIVGIGKETYDKYYKKTLFNWMDIVVDILGAGAGAFVFSVIVGMSLL